MLIPAGLAGMDLFLASAQEAALPGIASAQDAAGERPRVLDFEEYGVRIIQIKDPDEDSIQLSSPLLDCEAHLARLQRQIVSRFPIRLNSVKEHLADETSTLFGCTSGSVTPCPR